MVLATPVATASPAVERPPVTHQAVAATAVAHTEVRLLPRADASSAAWSTTSDTYDRGYIYPTTRSLRLAGCASTIDGIPADRIQSSPGPSWLLEPLDGQPVPPINLASEVGRCARTIQLPALGRWRITTTVLDAAGVPASETLERTFRDVLVAAVGDSFTSGEGNKLEGWVDGQCHRSYAAWPQELARSLETASTVVTFVSFACTGAGIEHLVSAHYSGAGDGPANLPPQLRALKSLLGDPRDPTTRPVDVLLGTVGLNAIPVGKILEECSIRHPFTHCRRNLGSQLATLPQLYDQLELGLSRNIRIGQAYFVGYPARIFTDTDDNYADCGVFTGMDTPEDDRWIDEQVTAVNTHLVQAARRHGWWRITSTKNLFRHHGYCADTTWFRSRQSSQNGQGNNMGTAHPNLQGQRETARYVRQFVRTNIPAPARDGFTVRFLRVKVTDKLKAWPGTFSISARPATFSGCGHQEETVTGLKLGLWNDLSANPCMRFSFLTAGRTVRIGASTHVNAIKKKEDIPQDQQQGGQPSSVRPGPILFSFGRFLRRASRWDATPELGAGHVVQRFVQDRGKAHVEFEYEITRPLVTKLP